ALGECFECFFIQAEDGIRDESWEGANGEASQDIWISMLCQCVRLSKNKVRRKCKEVSLSVTMNNGRAGGVWIQRHINAQCLVMLCLTKFHPTVDHIKF